MPEVIRQARCNLVRVEFVDVASNGGRAVLDVIQKLRRREDDRDNVRDVRDGCAVVNEPLVERDVVWRERMSKCASGEARADVPAYTGCL